DDARDERTAGADDPARPHHRGREWDQCAGRSRAPRPRGHFDLPRGREPDAPNRCCRGNARPARARDCATRAGHRVGAGSASKTLSHLGASGEARMVDVAAKPETERVAVAEGRVIMQPETLDVVLKGDAKKGDVLGAARIAGIMAAKRTHELIPLCHPLNI